MGTYGTFSNRPLDGGARVIEVFFTDIDPKCFPQATSRKVPVHIYYQHEGVFIFSLKNIVHSTF